MRALHDGFCSGSPCKFHCPCVVRRGRERAARATSKMQSASFFRRTPRRVAPSSSELQTWTHPSSSDEHTWKHPNSNGATSAVPATLPVAVSLPAPSGGLSSERVNVTPSVTEIADPLLRGARKRSRLASVAVADVYDLYAPRRGSLNVGRRGSLLKAQRLEARRGSLLKARLSLIEDSDSKHVGVRMDLPPAPETAILPQTSKGPGGTPGRSRWRDVSALLHAVNAERAKYGVNYRAPMAREARRGIVAFIVVSQIVQAFTG